jgi:ubiquinone biosynthesis protein
MEVQPQLLLLQKNMLMAEGVSRLLNPDLNIWTLAQPLIESWMRENRGPEARLRHAAGDMAGVIQRLPAIVTDFEKAVRHLAEGGIRLHPETVGELRRRSSRYDLAIWALAAAVAALAALLLLTQ